jgi:hypothetical protein
MTDQFDAPNQQVVRPDGSAPWDEGTGGGTDPEPAPAPPSDEPDDDNGDSGEQAKPRAKRSKAA